MIFDLSAEDLELNTCDSRYTAGSRCAAISITNAMNKVPAIVGDLIAGGSEVVKAIHQTLNKVVRPVLIMHRKFGAADTEPEEVITFEMEKHFGLPGFTLNRFEWN